MKLSKTYEPNSYEPTIYALWEKSGSFEPSGSGKPYSIVMPPPNANGNLHLGHALMADLEDILIRYHRMIGDNTIYIPGADHAGFETWVVYERALNKQGKSRTDFSREELYAQVWDFVDKQRGNMELQLRALGASASWKHLVFTLDKKVISTVYQTFKKLWDDGLVYRGERIVNYSTKFQTGYADIEVEHKNVKGTLWKIAYPLIDKIGEIVIATTRPETLLGDTAIAVNPKDERYRDLVGKHAVLPITHREIPIIADEYVDMSYGTGAVKITPAHDPNDFEVGKRHNLPRIQVIGFDGKMINVPPELAGLTVEEARKKVLILLEAEELRRGEEPIEHTVGFDYKSGLPIQPLIKDQWFLKVRPLAERAKQAIIDGKINFYPASRKHALIQYYDDLHDWNLSRQIPWGIPIPAFQNMNDSSDWIFDERVDQPTIVVNGTTYKREEDTFDTWFSSGQWPFITTDYLNRGDLAQFYPTSVLETGHDILYQWIARMIMLGLYATDEVPFHDVYLHGLILDEHGQKMSKSKGNVINPMDLIAKYGSDAVRLGLVSSRSAGQNQSFSSPKVIAGRNFCNKLWNIARFIGGKLPDDFIPQTNPQPTSLADHWVISELLQAAKQVGEHLDHYRFTEATELIYHTIWESVADWYIEASKQENNPYMLAWVLETSLKLAHPFAPFVTETIWQTLPWRNDLLISTSWPGSVTFDAGLAHQFTELQALVSETRYVTSELPGNKQYRLLYQKDDLIANHTELIKQLAHLSSVEKTTKAHGLRLAVSGRHGWLDVSDEELYEHQTNLEVRLAQSRQLVLTLNKRLDNPAYLKKAPEHLVKETRQQLADTKKIIDRLQAELDVLA